MAYIAIVYSTTDGHTRTICERVAPVIEAQGHRVLILPLEEALARDMGAFDKLVLGASIRYGRHHRRVYEFIERNRALLEQRPSAFFSVNAVARKAEKRGADTNPYVRKFLAQIPWRPDRVAVFAGRIDYPRYRFWDRAVIRLIMWMTGGPTDPSSVSEFTDWGAVEAFGRVVAEM